MYFTLKWYDANTLSHLSLSYLDVDELMKKNSLNSLGSVLRDNFPPS